MLPANVVGEARRLPNDAATEAVGEINPFRMVFHIFYTAERCRDFFPATDPVIELAEIGFQILVEIRLILGKTSRQSGSNVLVANGPVSMDQCGSVVLVSRSVVIKNSSTAFLFAQHVEGDVTTLFDSRDAMIFGAAAGLVGGLVMLVGRIFKRRR